MTKLCESTNLNLAERLFTLPEPIQILNGTKYVGDVDGSSSYFRNTMYYSGVAKVLDYLLVDKSINAIDVTVGAPTQVYVEVHGYKAQCGVNREVSYDAKDLPCHYGLVPIVMLALSDNFNAPKLKETFIKIVEEYNNKGCASEELVLEFCKQFEWEVMSPRGNFLDDFRIFRYDLNPASIKGLYESGRTKELSLLKDVAKLPKLVF